MAAGSSSRLGQPKQLLTFRDSLLLIHMIRECLESKLGDVYVVLGAYAKLIQPFLTDTPVKVLYNAQWPRGLSNSIAYGIKNMQKEQVDGVIIVLADQPYFSKELLLEIAQKKEEKNAPIIISQYERGAGPPSYFEASLFPELEQLDGDDGAKAVVSKYHDQVATIEFEKGHLDIDEVKDLEILRKVNSEQ